MKDKLRIETLLKVIEGMYSKNIGMQKLIDESMTDVCKEDGVSTEQIFFILLFFAVVFIIMDYPNMNFLFAKKNSL